MKLNIKHEPVEMPDRAVCKTCRHVVYDGEAVVFSRKISEFSCTKKGFPVFWFRPACDDYEREPGSDDE